MSALASSAEASSQLSLSVGLLAQLMRAHRGSSAAVSLSTRVRKFSIEWGVNVVETALRDATAVAQLLLSVD